MRLFLIIGFLVCFGINLSSQAEWKLRKEQRGVRAYTRDHKWSKFNEYKVQMTFEAKIENVLAVLKDFEVYPILFDGVEEVINHLDEPDRYINHIMTNTPFPAKDRDGVYDNKISFHQDERRLRIDMTCTNEYYESRKKYIQIKNCKGFWDMTETEDGKLKIIYQFVLDPGGVIPAFIINMQTVKNPIKTLLTLEKLVNLPKYQNVHFDILNN